MKITDVELRRVRLPLVVPFRTSFGTQTYRDALILQVNTPDGPGWGECTALVAPVFSAEYISGAHNVIREFLLPPLLERGDLSAVDVAPTLAFVKGHHMAKSAVEMAVLDAELRARGESFAEHLGGVREVVAAGVSVGITDSVGRLLDLVEGYIEAGYRRVKLKIEPGWDVEPVREVRERFGDDLLLQVDANTAYSLSDARHLARLDPFDLVLIEQPLPTEDLLGHAELARRIRTPICLDESVESAQDAARAIALGACAIVNIKPARVGGYLEARRVHDVCAAHGVPVWCGGMLETGIGRAANVALASLPNFTLPGDTSASARYFETDITEPFVLEDGTLRVPRGAGLGVTPLQDVVEAMTSSVEVVRGA